MGWIGFTFRKVPPLQIVNHWRLDKRRRFEVSPPFGIVFFFYLRKATHLSTWTQDVMSLLERVPGSSETTQEVGLISQSQPQGLAYASVMLLQFWVVSKNRTCTLKLIQTIILPCSDWVKYKPFDVSLLVRELCFDWWWVIMILSMMSPSSHCCFLALRVQSLAGNSYHQPLWSTVTVNGSHRKVPKQGLIRFPLT